MFELQNSTPSLTQPDCWRKILSPPYPDPDPSFITNRVLSVQSFNRYFWAIKIFIKISVISTRTWVTTPFLSFIPAILLLPLHVSRAFRPFSFSNNLSISYVFFFLARCRRFDLTVLCNHASLTFCIIISIWFLPQHLSFFIPFLDGFISLRHRNICFASVRSKADMLLFCWFCWCS